MPVVSTPSWAGWATTTQFPLLLVVAFLSGCVPSQRGLGKVFYSDGGCVLFIDGVSSIQATEITKEWRMKGCEIVITNEVGKD